VLSLFVLCESVPLRTVTAPSKQGREILLLAGHKDSVKYLEIDMRGLCTVECDSNQERLRTVRTKRLAAPKTARIAFRKLIDEKLFSLGIFEIERESIS
jgi:hypothetical protein